MQETEEQLRWRMHAMSNSYRPAIYKLDDEAAKWLDGQPACQKLPGPCKRGLPVVI